MFKLSTLIDLLTIAGLALVVFGLYLYNHALLFVVGGVIAFIAARALARAEDEKKKREEAGG